MTALPTIDERTDCWTRIGVWGDRSCPELAPVVHCHNCPVFSAAGRRFLATPAPTGYLESWTARLADMGDDEASDVQGVLIFRLGDEWLALPVAALHEVMALRPIHRIPFHGGLLAGVANVRGELHLSVRMDHLLGIAVATDVKDIISLSSSLQSSARLLLAGNDAETWLFRVDEVDRVYRLAASELKPVPPTLGRATARLTHGVFRCQERAVGLLDDERLFEAVRASMR
jgi:chemotaxis-related protein WspD